MNILLGILISVLIPSDPIVPDLSLIVPTPVIEKPATATMNEEEKSLIARLVMAEAGNQDFEGKRLVAATVLNRMESKTFPNTVEGVIYQKNQFSPVIDGALERAKKTVTKDCFDAVNAEIAERIDPGVLYFMAGRYSSYGTPAYKHGDHYFSYE